MKNKYGAGYFEKGEGSGYKNYSWKPKLIGPRLNIIINTTKVSPPNKILDFGCAKGYYVRWLRQKGFKAIGLDVSSYALAKAFSDTKKYLFSTSKKPLASFKDKEFDLTIAKDVLEHLSEYKLKQTIKKLSRISKKLVVIVPICNPNRKYVNNKDENDVTHNIRYTKKEWLKILNTKIENKVLCKKIKGKLASGTLCAIIN